MQPNANVWSFRARKKPRRKMHFSYILFVFKYKFNDWRNQSADELIGEPTPFNQQQKMQPWYFGTRASASRAGFSNNKATTNYSVARRWSSGITEYKRSIGEVDNLARYEIDVRVVTIRKTESCKPYFWTQPNACFKFPGTQEAAAKRHKTGCILLAESQHFNTFADWRKQSVDNWICEPTLFNQQRKMQPWYFGMKASAIRLGFRNRRSGN